jgi:hypothetical protein
VAEAKVFRIAGHLFVHSGTNVVWKATISPGISFNSRSRYESAASVRAAGAPFGVGAAGTLR